MTLKRYYTLVCNGCGIERDAVLCVSPEKARQYAKRVGWTRIAGEYGDRTGWDLCPKCHNESKPATTEQAAPMTTPHAQEA